MREIEVICDTTPCQLAISFRCTRKACCYHLYHTCTPRNVSFVEKNGPSSSNTPKTEEASSSNAAVVYYQYTWRHIPDDLNAQKKCYEQFKSHSIYTSQSKILLLYCVKELMF